MTTARPPAPMPGWQDVSHGLPLGGPPIIQQVGLNVHGSRRVESYVMDQLWSLHVYRWRGTLDVGGKLFPVRPGYLSVEPPNTRLTWRYDMEACPHHYVHFALRGDGPTTPVPAMQDLGPAFPEISEEMHLLVTLFEQHRRRAEVRLWDLLLRLSRMQTGRPEGSSARTVAGPDLPFAVQTAVAIIDNELRDKLEVAAICKRVGISQNHLTRLFQHAFGVGVAAYVRRRRVDKARHLLTASSLPIKAIAAEVGVPNLQQFNKLVRAVSLRSPRAWRDHGADDDPAKP